VDTGQLRTAALRSARPEPTVPGVAEAGDDVALLVKALIERGDMDRHDLLVPLDLRIYDDEEPATRSSTSSRTRR